MTYTAPGEGKAASGCQNRVAITSRKKNVPEQQGESMTFSRAVPRALLAFVAIGLVQVIAGILVPMPMAVAPHFLLWLALSNALFGA